MQNSSEKPKIFLSVLFYEFTLSLSAGILISIFKSVNLIPTNSAQKFVNNSPIWIVFMIAVFFSPFVEELIFRLSLRLNEKYMHLNILILVGGLTFTIAHFFNVNFFKILIISLGMILFLFYLNNKGLCNKFILGFWNRNFKYVFYFSVMSFGLLHINNYGKINNSLLLILPILILPQLITGLFCGYVRLKLGFSWGCLLHSVHNFILLIPSIMVALLS